MSIKQERREGLISKILGKKGVVDVVRGVKINIHTSVLPFDMA
jgi:hypothetical protein